jgi:hypothetical protein
MQDVENIRLVCFQKVILHQSQLNLNDCRQMEGKLPLIDGWPPEWIAKESVDYVRM